MAAAFRPQHSPRPPGHRSERVLTAAVAFLALAFLALASLTGCGAEERAEAAEKAAKEQEVAPVTVTCEPVVRGAIDDYIVATSTLRATHSAAVSAALPGLVEHVEVEEGTWVDQGQVLARVDYRELGLAERKASATLDKAEADLTRSEKLADSGLLSDEALETAHFEAGKARLSLNEANVALQKATVRAPISGVIASRTARTGDRVAIGQEMFEIVDTRTLEADLHVPERFLDELAAGQRCLLTSETRGGQATVEASVLRIAPIVDADSGTVKVVVGLHASDDAPLRPGQFVRAQLVTVTHADAALIPKKAVVYEDGQPMVFVRDGDVARAVPFEPGLANSDHVEALGETRGLEPDALVVVAGQAALSDGTRIRTAAEALAARDAESKDEDQDEGTPAEVSQVASAAEAGS